MSEERYCGQCGKPLLKRADFCDWRCARDRGNTKMVRGAKLHDMLVEWRGDYRKRYLLKDITRVVGEWIKEDRESVPKAGQAPPV